MKKKIVSYIVFFTMVVTMLPVTAFAEEETNNNAVRSTPHTHCICGAVHTAIGNHTDEDEYTGEWIPISDLSQIIPGTTDSPNYYYLTTDMVIEEAGGGGWSPKVKTIDDSTVLCLNGHSITCTQNTSAVISIKQEGYTLTLTDCQNTQGKITHKSGAAGCGVENHGTFNMYGGNITGNIATRNGGGVLNYRSFNLYGGSITNNNSGEDRSGNPIGSGGGVYNNTSSSSVIANFTMYGGTIKGNVAAFGGGVENNSTFSMFGGSIVENKALYGSESAIGGVTNKGILNLSGEAVVVDNVRQYMDYQISDYTYAASNLANESLENVETDEELNTINIIGTGLSGKARIGISTHNCVPDKNEPLPITGDNRNKDYSSYFFSDNTKYEIFNDATDSDHQVVKLRLSDTTGTIAIAELIISVVSTNGTIIGDTATNGGTLSYYLVSGNKLTEINRWTVDTADTQVATDLGVIAEASKPTLTTSENGKYLVVVETKNGKVIAAGQSGVIVIQTTPDPTPDPDPEPDVPTYVPTPTPNTGNTNNKNDKTETVTNPDGSTTTTETKKDGTVIETTKNEDGSETKTETKKDGTVTETNTTATGTTATTVTDDEGNVTESKVTVSNEDANSDETVTLPVQDVKPTDKSEDAQEITVEIPEDTTVTVEIPVEDVTPGTVIIIVDEDGNETVVSDTKLTENGVSMTLDGNVTIKIVDNSKDFNDVDEDYWGKNAIDFVSSRELFSGVNENEYAPEETMTRAMLFTVLARLDGQDTTHNGDGAWYQKSMNWAKEAGISDGTDPNGSITREQLATMLYRYAGEPEVSGENGTDKFSDHGDVSDWAAKAMQWAVENGILNGMDDGTLNPQGEATRAQVATMLMRFLGK